MIAVIADDFSGAAELGGIGLRYHLSVEVNTTVNPRTQANVLIIATDARSLSKQEAVLVMQKIMQQLVALQPEMIFKKTDSVLRGHILAELAAQLPIAQCEKAVLVPANPTLGRTIQNGRYFLHGQPVHETSFSEDPDFAITSSVIEDMLQVNGHTVHIKKVHEPLPAEGIIVGEATATQDLQAWAARIDHQTLAAGAAGFFEAILEIKLAGKQPLPNASDLVQHARPFSSTAPSLFVCGSTFANSRQQVQQLHAVGGPVSYMPENIMPADLLGRYSYIKWGDEVTNLIKKYGKAVVAIHPDTNRQMPVQPVVLRKKMAGLVNEVLQRGLVKELFIEGGATAWSVVNASGLTRFFPVQETGAGVVRMCTHGSDLCVTVKPGSYPWPAAMWNF
jgi:Uncharacterized protein conserved in bacteria